MGQKGVKNEVFRHFLGNGSFDFVFFPTERRYYSITYVCQVTSPGKIWFSRYGAKRGSKWGFSGFSQKLVYRFGSISYRRKILLFYICVPSFRSEPFLVPEIEGQTGVKMGQKWVFRSFLKNWQTDLVPSLREGRHYHSTYLCQVSSPGHFSFSRYRVKWGSKRVKNGVFVVFSKTS